MKKTLRANVFLLLIWIIFTNTLAIERILWGVAVVALLQFFYGKKMHKEPLGFKFSGRLLWKWMQFSSILVKEIIVANIQVAVIVLKKTIVLDSGYFRYKTKLKSDFYKMVFANAITLTPGTISVDVEGDEIIVHYLTTQIIEGFEDSIMEKILLEMEGGI